MKFTKVNVNPSGRKASDCVIRAIMSATGKTWREVYDGLCNIGRELHDLPNTKRVYESYLENLGWTKQKMPKFADGTRYTVAEFADANSAGVYVISVAKHMTILKHGELLDTWNCSYKSVGNFWAKNK